MREREQNHSEFEEIESLSGKLVRDTAAMDSKDVNNFYNDIRFPDDPAARVRGLAANAALHYTERGETVPEHVRAAVDLKGDDPAPGLGRAFEREIEMAGVPYSVVPSKFTYICALADKYCSEDEHTAQEDLRRVIDAEGSGDEYRLFVRRGRLGAAHARCYRAEDNHTWLVIVNENCSPDTFREVALREIAAHILRPEPTGDALRMVSPFDKRFDHEHQDETSSQREPYQTWVSAHSHFAPAEKRAIAHHVVTHIVQRQTVIQIASGTTLTALMEAIIRNGIEDLQIATNNLQVMLKGRGNTHLGNMSITLLGGGLNDSLGSLIGPETVQMITNDEVMPDAVFFGAAGLSFENGLRISYAFQDELATHVAYATRPTQCRVLMADHTKLGKISGRRAPVTVASLLEHAEKCYIISTFKDEWVDVINREAAGLRRLLEPLVGDPRYIRKDFQFRLVDLNGSVIREHSLSQLRLGNW